MVPERKPTTKPEMNLRVTLLAVLVVIGATVVLETLQHLALKDLPLVWFNVIAGVSQGGVTLVAVAFYLRWRRRVSLAQQELESAHQTEVFREDMTAMLVHDLKNPLVASSMALQALMRRQSAASCFGDEEKHFLDVVRESQRRLSNMIEDLLQISQAESGKLGLQFSDIDLCELGQRTVESASTFGENDQVEVTFACEAPLMVQGDRQKLRRVLENLISNALRFTPPGGKVSVQIVAAGDNIQLQVSDTGPGIPAEFHKRIFEKYAQIGPGRRMSVGLGLSFCKLISEAHGGSIAVDSTVGQGSTFTVTLPQRNPLALAPQTPPAESLKISP